MSSPSSRAPVRRPLLVALFAIYLVLLVWVVLWKLEVPWVGDDRVVKVVPFVATPDAGASSTVELAANLALFLPFGVYLGLAHRSLRERATGVMTTACSLGTVVVLACAGMYLASPLHLVHLRDAGPLARSVGAE